MEDIEDLLVGSGGGGAPPGFRLPINAVGVNPRKNKNKPLFSGNQLSKINDSLSPLSSEIPGTQVLIFPFFLVVSIYFIL